MPTYHYHCKKCDKHWEELLKIAEMDNPIKAPCPHCKSKKKEVVERLMESPKIVSGVEGQASLNPSGAFKEVMAKVKEAHPKGNWANKHGGKNAYKEV